jgi:hypothetical protein
MSAIMERIEHGAFRLAVRPTVQLAITPSLFGEIRQPDTDYLLVPKVSSERRHYIPFGFLKANVVANGSALIIPNATVYHFGVLSSVMHMAWMRTVCGSNGIINTPPAFFNCFHGPTSNS